MKLRRNRAQRSCTRQRARVNELRRPAERAPDAPEMVHVGRHASRIVFVVRWPVGGIRTYLQRLIMDASFRDLQFTLVLPDIEESHVLQRAVQSDNLRWVWSANSSWSLATSVLKEIMRARPALVHSHGFTSAVCSARFARCCESHTC